MGTGQIYRHWEQNTSDSANRYISVEHEIAAVMSNFMSPELTSSFEYSQLWFAREEAGYSPQEQNPVQLVIHRLSTRAESEIRYVRQ